MRPVFDRHFEASANLSTWAIARRLPHTLGQGARIGWRTDRRAVLVILACQIGAAFLTATALTATARLLSTLGTGADIADALQAGLPVLVALTIATSGQYVLSATAAAAAAQLAPGARREADLDVIAAATAAELVAYEDPVFADAHTAASEGAKKTGDLVLDAQMLTSAAAQMAAAATVVTILHPLTLPLLAASAVPRAWGAVRGARIEHAAHHRGLSDSRLRSVFRSHTTERGSADEVRAGTMAGFLIHQYRVVSGRLEAEQLRASRRALVVQGIGDALTAVGTGLTWAVLILLVATGHMELAVAGTAALAVRTAGAALTTTVRAGARLFRTSLSLDDWARFLAVAKPWTNLRGTAGVPEDGPHLITARDVCFTYPGAKAPALDRICLDLERGEIIALVGENGSGKTTLARLLTGLYLPTSGAVTWDGVDLADADPSGVLAKVAIVPQDYTRWPLAARENITLGQPRSAGDAAVHAAAEASGADAVIAALPAGLDTSLARSWWGGHDLSGGQWQRIALARAFHRDAPVLVMDEPTAALDARAEHRILTQLKALAAGRATVFITHRLANTRLADRIIVLDGGRVSETGTFDELVGRGSASVFFQMLTLQEERHRVAPDHGRRSF